MFGLFKKKNPDFKLVFIEFSNKEDAEDSLNRLKEMHTKYGIVSVLDYYDIVSYSGKYTDTLYGWKKLNFNRVKIVQSKNGFTILLPPVEVL